MDRKEVKAQAKLQIKPHIKNLCLITLIYLCITFVAELVLGNIPVLGSVAVGVVITPALTLGFYKVFLRLGDGIEPQIADIFSGFEDFWSAFKVQFLASVFTFLWMLLLIIPGIIKAYSYSMAHYILAENPGMSARECISRSKKMMEGHKMEAFILGLSFIGWFLLGAVTLGIAYLWIMPYMQMTMVNFYNRIKPAPAVVDAAPTEEVPVEEAPAEEAPAEEAPAEEI
jgi:uncharacterized membrane protein